MKSSLIVFFFSLFAFIGIDLVVPTAASTAQASEKVIALMNGDMGYRRPKGCPSRWCACYMDLILKQAGYKIRNSWRARDFASYGKPARAGSVGSIIVFPHHVGVVIGKCPNGRIKVVSGNHGNRVGVGCYNPRSAIAWRKPVRQ